MRVLVTGATGFLGGHLMEVMSPGEHEMIATFRSSSNTDLIDSLGVEKRSMDLGDPRSMVEATEGVDVVVHLAAYYTFTGRRDLYHRINVEGTMALMEACEENGVDRVIYCSSTEAMGPVNCPPADESSPLCPTYEYGRSKVKAESIVRSFEGRVDHTILRPSGIYGPRNLEDVSYYFVTSFANSIASKFIVGSGENLVQFVHVRDVVKGVSLSIENYDASKNGIYIISEGRAHPYREVYSILADILGTRSPRMHLPASLAKLMMAPVQGMNRLLGRDNFMWRVSTVDSVTSDRSYSIEKARRELGFEPSYDLRSGLEETVTWYKENGYI